MIIKDEYDTFDGYVDALEDRVAELEEVAEAAMEWANSAGQMPNKLQRALHVVGYIKCTHDWQAVDAHSEDCKICGESRLSPLGGGE